jgi:hypothetical protein
VADRLGPRPERGPVQRGSTSTPSRSRSGTGTRTSYGSRVGRTRHGHQRPSHVAGVRTTRPMPWTSPRHRAAGAGVGPIESQGTPRCWLIEPRSIAKSETGQSCLIEMLRVVIPRYGVACQRRLLTGAPAERSCRLSDFTHPAVMDRRRFPTAAPGTDRPGG